MSKGRTTFGIWAQKPGESWFHVGDEYGATRSKAIAKFRTFDGRSFPAKTKFYARRPSEVEILPETTRNPSSIRAQVRRLPSGLIQLKIPLRSQNPSSVAEAMQAVRKLGRRVKSAVVIGGTKVRSYITKPKSKRKR